MATQEFDVGIVARKTRKGKKIVVKEEKHVCQSIFHMLQDPIKGNGWNNQMF